ncbi:MAG: nicotinate-nucleotide adenylyltransferase [Lachnospiraceae bacterium]|nr:nicotinate-nucleotide adenylyltransferase [Lachnospiraceae bacterium]
MKERGTEAKRRVGIMGGTFDPIHIGHLILGESAYQQFNLEKVLFMPSGNPPHKKNRQGASNQERVEMVRRAIASNPHFELSLEEMHEQGYIYTRETLERLRTAHPDTEYYFIMGADSLLNFETWKDPEEICRLCILVAAVRDHMPQDKLDEKICFLRRKYQADIRKLESLNIDISSHTLRSWVAEGRSCRYYIPENVVFYIKEHRIYQE